MSTALHASGSFAWALAAAAGCVALAACDDAPPIDAAYRHVEGGSPERGLRAMARYQCGSCHAIPGAVTHGVRAGPPLDGFGRRSYIGGRLPSAPDTLQRWLRDPKALEPRTTMPHVGVTDEDARDIAAYLLSLR